MGKPKDSTIQIADTLKGHRLDPRDVPAVHLLRVASAANSQGLILSVHHSSHSRYSYVSPISLVQQRELRVWDQSSRQLLMRSLPEPEEGRIVQLSPDARKVLISSLGRVYEMDVQNGRVTQEFVVGERVVGCAADCNTVLIQPSNDGSLASYDLKSGKVAQRFRVPLSGNPDGTLISSEFLDRDSKIAAVFGRPGMQQSLFVWDNSTGDLLTSLELDIDTLVGHFSSDGTRYAAAHRDGVVEVFDVVNPHSVFKSKTHLKHIWSMAFTVDSDELAVAGESMRLGGTSSGMIQVLSVPSARTIATLVEDSCWGVTSVLFAFDGTLLCGDSNGQISRIRDPS